MKAKGKMKKSIGRFGRMHIASKETAVAEPPDLSQLRKPIDTNLGSLKQVAELLAKGSEEVKAILAYECDVVYECRVCRSLFRSLANFISHKRVYCSEKFDVTLNRCSMDPTTPDRHRSLFETPEGSMESEYKENCTNDRILRSTSTVRKEPKNDLTAIVDMLKKKQNGDCESMETEIGAARPLRITSDHASPILLEIMTSNQAAYQTVLPAERLAPPITDLMKNQTLELSDMLNRNTAVLGPDGQVVGVDSCRGIEEKDQMSLNPGSVKDLTCSKCKATFATKKTLTFHVKSKHMEHLMNWPCPSCTSIFTNRASVYRHLIKVHRKTTDQMRKLRPQIRALVMSNAELAMRKGSEARNGTETINESPNFLIAQKWMQNLELDTELQRCGACGKRFDRKAALASHSLICSKRSPSVRNSITGRRKRASKVPPQRLTEIAPPSNEETTTNVAAKEKPATNVAAKEKPVTNVAMKEKPVTNVAMKEKPATNEAAREKPATIEAAIEKPATIEAAIEKPATNEPTIDDSIARKSPKIEIQDYEIPEDFPSISVSRVGEDSPVTTIRVGDVSSLSKDVWDKIGTDLNTENPQPRRQRVSGPKSRMIQKSLKSSTSIVGTASVPPTEIDSLPAVAPDVPEVIYTTIDNSRPVALSVLSKEQKLGIQYRGIRLPTVTLEKINIPRGRVNCTPSEPSISVNLSTERSIQIDKKLSTHANIRKLQCLPCNRKFMSLINLRRHLAVHLKRNRYRCKLCDFKTFLKCDCIAHCNKRHNARNNRTILAEIVLEMPLTSDQTENEKIAKNSDTEAKDEPEVIDVTMASTSTRKTKPTANEAISLEERNKKITSAKERTAAVESLPKYVTNSKPKRGRPPKSKKRRGRKKGVRRVLHVSPPTLTEELSEADEADKVVDPLASPRENSAERFTRLSRGRAPSRMDCDPELRKMVMEVIFGSAEKPSEDPAEKISEKMTVDDDVVCERVLDSDESTVKNIAETAINATKEDDIDIQISTVNDTNSNFQYDLKTMSYPKDIMFLQGPIVETDDLTGRSLVQLQSHDAHCDDKFAGDGLLVSPTSITTDGGLIIYEDRAVDVRLAGIQQGDIVFCAEK